MSNYLDLLKNLTDYQTKARRVVKFVVCETDLQEGWTIIHAWKAGEPEFETELPIAKYQDTGVFSTWEHSGFVRKVLNPYRDNWGPVFELTEVAFRVASKPG